MSVPVAAQRLVGRVTGGHAAALTGAQAMTILTGQSTGAFSFNSKKITSVADCTAAQDAATKNYVDTRPYTGNVQATTTYTFVLADRGKFVPATNGSPVTFKVPTNASVAFPLYTRIRGAQLGAGKITLTPFSTVVTIQGARGKKTRAQYSDFELIKTSTNTWIACGDLSTS